MAQPFIIAALLTYCLVREAFFMHTMHKLMNKLMSRNYHEYQMGERVMKPVDAPKPTFVDPDAAEDLEYIAF